MSVNATGCELNHADHPSSYKAWCYPRDTVRVLLRLVALVSALSVVATAFFIARFAGAGIEELSVERRGLHDAFVAIAGESAAREMEADEAASLGDAA